MGKHRILPSMWRLPQEESERVLKASVFLTVVLSLSFVLSLSSTGCRSFLRDQAMKDYTVKIKPTGGVTAPNRYQEDFLYLKALGEEVFPLEDRYFPPDKRAGMEQEILGKPCNCLRGRSARLRQSRYAPASGPVQ